MTSAVGPSPSASIFTNLTIQATRSPFSKAWKYPRAGYTPKLAAVPIKELERDLSRKDKALAETAALLVLSKKLSAICRDGEDA